MSACDMKGITTFIQAVPCKAVFSSKSETKWENSPVMLEKFHQSVGMKISAPSNVRIVHSDIIDHTLKLIEIKARIFLFCMYIYS